MYGVHSYRNSDLIHYTITLLSEITGSSLLRFQPQQLTEGVLFSMGVLGFKDNCSDAMVFQKMAFVHEVIDCAKKWC